MHGNESGKEVFLRSCMCHCHIQSMLGIVVVAGGIYGGKMHVWHELKQNCVTD